jgi:Putative Actinobacterial Holin-X, holin superfamily III
MSGAEGPRGSRSMADHDTRRDARDRPVAELMRDLSDQTTALVRKEFELAKLELAAKGKQAGVGAGMFGAAALFGAGAFAALTTCLIRALDTVVTGWLAALIVTVAYVAIAGVLALRGKKQVKQATPPVPARAVDSTKEDVEWLKTRAKSGREG